MKIALKLLVIAGMVATTFAAKNIPVYTKSELTGRLDPETHKEYTRVSSAYSSQNTYMRTEAYEAFVKMAKAAQQDGVNLTIVSGTRNRNRQIEIWSEKWNRFSGSDVERAEEILLYSSMPGTSRHHWGTDIDLNSVEPEYFETTNGQKTYEWLEKNALRFGYFQPYIKKGNDRKVGYREEKWHWSYYPTANQMLKAYKRMITYADIVGFPGAEVASEIAVFDRFVEGIPDLNEQNNGYFQVEEASTQN